MQKRSHRSERKQKYVLSKFKEIFKNSKTRIITKKAYEGAVALGYISENDIVEIIQKLCNQNFYKSMTSDRFKERWQDVYVFSDLENENKVYIKIQITEEKAILVQFKEFQEEEI